jgi:hypothetical protein
VTRTRQWLLFHDEREQWLHFRAGQQSFTLRLLAGEFICPSYGIFLFPDAPF